MGPAALPQSTAALRLAGPLRDARRLARDGSDLNNGMTPGSPTGDSHGTLVTDVLPFSSEQFGSLPGVA